MVGTEIFLLYAGRGCEGRGRGGGKTSQELSRFPEDRDCQGCLSGLPVRADPPQGSESAARGARGWPVPRAELLGIWIPSVGRDSTEKTPHGPGRCPGKPGEGPGARIPWHWPGPSSLWPPFPSVSAPRLPGALPCVDGGAGLREVSESRRGARRRRRASLQDGLEHGTRSLKDKSRPQVPVRKVPSTQFTG